MNTYFKWSLIVGFNTIVSTVIIIDLFNTVPGALAVLAGIISYILLYAMLDTFLMKTNRKEWRKSLLIATVMMGLFSLYPAIPMVSGALALDMTSWLFNQQVHGIKDTPFLPIFITTLFSGMILSGVVIVLTGLARLFLLQKFKYAKTVVDNG